MFKGRSCLIVLLSFCLVFFVTPQEKSEAFILRAAARAVGAVVGVAAGIAVGAARVVAGAVRLAAAGVARVAVGAFRVGRFLLFGRPWYGLGYRPWWPYRWGWGGGYGYGYSPYYANNWGSNAGNWGTHGGSMNWVQPRQVADDNACANLFPIPESTTYEPSTCWADWNGSRFNGRGNSPAAAAAWARREMCKYGADQAKIAELTITCRAGGN